MKLINKTKYDAAQLRAVLVAVHQEEAKRRGRLKTWNVLTVSVSRRLGASTSTSGHAFYHGRKAHLTIPAVTCTTAALAALWLHELQHLYGIRHPDMSPAVRDLREPELSPWIDAACMAAETDTLQEAQELHVLLSAEEKAARLDDRRQKALTNVEARIVRWERKLSRAKKAIAKLHAQQKYYQGALAAARRRGVE